MEVISCLINSEQQGSLANIKVSMQQQCMYEGP